MMRLRDTVIFGFVFLISLSLPAQKVGINTNTPEFELDIRGTDDHADGAELQLSTPSATNFLRFFGGRLGDRHPFMAFHDEDTFHIVTTLPDWSTYTRRMTLLPTGNLGIGTITPINRLDVRNDGEEDEPTTVLGLVSDVSNRPVLQFSEWETALPNSGMAIEYDGTGANQLNILGTDALPKFSFTTSGNFGIGVEEPQARLHILGGQWNLSATEGDINIGSPSYRLAAGVITSGISAGICRIYAKGGAARLILGSDDTDVLIIDSTNRVGIGAGAGIPHARLHVYSTNGSLGSTEGDFSIGSTTRRLGIGVAINGVARMYAKGGAARLIFGSDDTDVMVIDSANNVGIGIAVAMNRLDVRSDGVPGSSTTVLGLISNTSDRPVLQFSAAVSATSTSGMAIEYLGIGGSSTRRLNIRGTDVLPKVTFTDGGRVGIGTESPNELLEIGGNGRIFIGDGGGINRKGLFIDAGQFGATWVTLWPRDYGENSELDLYIPGNVGIGTSTPEEKLVVIGNICATGSIGTCSDARYKTQIRPIHHSLAACLALMPCTYQWNTGEYPDLGFTQDAQIGLIAQDVQKVFPELVLENNAGYLSVDYSKLSVLLLVAIKEQQAEIDRQESALQLLTARIAKLEGLPR